MSDLQESLGMIPDKQTNVDIVFVIDVTRSMDPIIDMVKRTALSFRDLLEEKLKSSHHVINNLRIKVIWFRDFYYDGNQAYGESDFFELPEQKEDFHKYVESLEAKGGGDLPESSLEALTMAMRSDFVQTGDSRRHIIALFTDDGAHPLEDYDKLVEEAAKESCRPTMYPDNMPKDIEEFYRMWQKKDEETQEALGVYNLDPKGRRLVLFAPDAYPWNDLETDLEYVFRKPIEAGQGGKDLVSDDMAAMLAYSYAE